MLYILNSILNYIQKINYKKGGNIMLNEKIIALLMEIGGEIENINIISDNEIEVDGFTYLVLDDDESDDYYYDLQRQLIDDMGLEGFTESFQNWIINNCIDIRDFDEMLEESNRIYIDDIREDSASSDNFENRLEEEIEENGFISEDEFLEYLNKQWNNSIEWYRDFFGDNELSNYIKNNSYLINWDKVIEECKSIDGRGYTISSYDGEEIELEDGYYAYRI